MLVNLRGVGSEAKLTLRRRPLKCAIEDTGYHSGKQLQETDQPSFIQLQPDRNNPLI